MQNNVDLNQPTLDISFHYAPSQSSLSTKATASDLPGPGRTIGLLYDLLGAIIEKRISMRTHYNSSQSSISTMATAPNLPGAGRTLGLLYDFLGGKLERRIGKIAETVGAGPRAVAVRIERDVTKIHWARLWLPNSNGNSFSRKAHAKLKRESRKLLKYAFE